jgi:16S rRNA (guanine527-N7)-methyltransferase
VNADARLAELAARRRLAADAIPRLRAMLELLAGDPLAPTSVTRADDAVDVHLADALSALEVGALRTATRIADLGSGAGVPGLVLAIALPQADVVLLDSSHRKCAFLERACAVTGTRNASVVCARAEAWPDGLGRHDAVTARAVGPLALLCEYAAPLLAVGGTLIAWKGAVAPAEAIAGDRAARKLGLEAAAVVRVAPYPGSAAHHLHMYLKTADTPSRFPRRPGAAQKRPLGGVR